MRELSQRALSAWAKLPYGPVEGENWHLPLVSHLFDVASAMQELMDRWVSPSAEALAARQFQDDSQWTPMERLKAVAVFLAVVHDIGKLSPAFAAQGRWAVEPMLREGLAISPDVYAERRLLRHELAGDIALSDWLTARGVREARALSSVVGGHHGIPPNPPQFMDGMLRVNLLGADLWADARIEMLDYVVAELGLDPHIESWRDIEWSEPILVYLNGLLIMADWLGSNSDYFPLIREGEDPRQLLEPEVRVRRAEEGGRLFELPVPWQPRDLGGSADELLRTRFGLPATAVATATQVASVEMARTMELPGLLIVQDVMGTGKTESAFMAAEILAARTGRRGMLFALPTQATTDAMFGRTIEWLERLSHEYGDTDVEFSTQLMHGRAHLNERTRDLKKAGWQARDRLLGGIGESGRSAAPESAERSSALSRGGALSREDRLEMLPWFSGRKKSILADFVVSTVDHVLFAAMRSPHLALRHIGLERKVVVIDEVHSYSVYMNQYLERALQWLGAMRVPVIMLSATLSHEQTGRFHIAYRAGVRSQLPLTRRSRERAEPIDAPYPCVVAAGTEQLRIEDTSAGSTQRRVLVREMPRKLSIADHLDELLRDGGCALVVRNTVRGAQETFSELEERFGPEVTLSHARFTIEDRQRKDLELLHRFGPPRLGGSRPHRAIVVATQVVEQSLDVDFDILITDLAPIDLVLQRIGRLHRHDRPRPNKLASATCYVAHLPSTASSEPYLEPGGAAVYGPAVLLRSAATLLRVISETGEVVLPRDMTELLESVYGPRDVVPSTWQLHMSAAQAAFEAERRELVRAAHGFLLKPPRGPSRAVSLHGWLEGAAPEEAEGINGVMARAQVREGGDSIEVLLVERDGSTIRTLPGFDGQPGAVVPTDRVPDRMSERQLAMSSVRLPNWCAQSRYVEAVLNDLEANGFVDAWQSSPMLRGQLVLALTNGRAQLAGRTITYSRELGLGEEKV